MKLCITLHTINMKTMGNFEGLCRHKGVDILEIMDMRRDGKVAYLVDFSYESPIWIPCKADIEWPEHFPYGYGDDDG